jgi:hypothetical protein
MFFFLALNNAKFGWIKIAFLEENDSPDVFHTSYVLNKQNNTYKLVKKNNEARGFMGSVPTLNVDVDI